MSTRVESFYGTVTAVVDEEEEIEDDGSFHKIKINYIRAQRRAAQVGIDAGAGARAKNQNSESRTKVLSNCFVFCTLQFWLMSKSTVYCLT